VSEEPVSSLSSSFTDLMTSLAVIFILLLVAATNSQVQKLKKASEKEKHATQDARGKLLNNLRHALPGMEIYPDRNDPLAVIVLVPEGLLNFEFRKSDIPAAGQDFLKHFIPKLADVVCATSESVNSVVVEGHTDQVGPDLANVKLSQERSMAVVEAALNTLGSDRTNYTCFLRLMSASGRGKNDPRFTAIGKIDEGSSRRVEFHLRVPSSEQREMKEKLKTSPGASLPADSE
jgi:outer membrane protein OmpA-like peptidoglycan-associated protein